MKMSANQAVAFIVTLVVVAFVSILVVGASLVVSAGDTPSTTTTLPALPLSRSECVTVGWRAVFVEGGVATIEDERCK